MVVPVGYQITCANKNLNGTIVRIGGSGWSLSCQEAIRKIISKQQRFHMFIGDESFDIGVRGEGDDAFLVLEPEAKALDEVDGLEGC